MEQNQKLDLISLAIQRLIEEKKNDEVSGTVSFVDHGGGDGEQLLSQFLYQLDTLREGDMLKQSETSSPLEGIASAVGEKEGKNENVIQAGDNSIENKIDEIVKELKKVRRQNFVTHCLLSVMIVLTVAWQLSEVSLLLKVKDGLNHPFRSFGSMLSGFLTVPDRNGQAGVKNSFRFKQPHE
ncbi:Ciliary neurotrophic factor [Quillaja saponaria]|uniref:Ciliary neurotrophic factor n=1 Tax=Quillaja saponaria TaxID=32244 RepID=A0AAD7P838_QUISA|nr:Ciliary neurotrophic factor [Quillaja saponaria]